MCFFDEVDGDDDDDDDASIRRERDAISPYSAAVADESERRRRSHGQVEDEATEPSILECGVVLFIERGRGWCMGDGSRSKTTMNK